MEISIGNNTFISANSRQIAGEAKKNQLDSNQPILFSELKGSKNDYSRNRKSQHNIISTQNQVASSIFNGIPTSSKSTSSYLSFQKPGDTIHSIWQEPHSKLKITYPSQCTQTIIPQIQSTFAKVFDTNSTISNTPSKFCLNIWQEDPISTPRSTTISNIKNKETIIDIVFKKDYHQVKNKLIELPREKAQTNCLRGDQQIQQVNSKFKVGTDFALKLRSQKQLFELGYEFQSDLNNQLISQQQRQKFSLCYLQPESEKYQQLDDHGNHQIQNENIISGQSQHPSLQSVKKQESFCNLSNTSLDGTSSVLSNLDSKLFEFQKQWDQLEEVQLVKNASIPFKINEEKMLTKQNKTFVSEHNFENKCAISSSSNTLYAYPQKKDLILDTISEQTQLKIETQAESDLWAEFQGKNFLHARRQDDNPEKNEQENPEFANKELIQNVSIEDIIEYQIYLKKASEEAIRSLPKQQLFSKYHFNAIVSKQNVNFSIENMFTQKKKMITLQT